MRENGLTGRVLYSHLPTSVVCEAFSIRVDYPDEIRLILFSGQVLDASLWGSNITKFFPVCESFQVVPKQGNVTARLDV